MMLKGSRTILLDGKNLLWLGFFYFCYSQLKMLVVSGFGQGQEILLLKVLI